MQAAEIDEKNVLVAITECEAACLRPLHALILLSPLEFSSFCVFRGDCGPSHPTGSRMLPVEIYRGRVR